MFVFFLLFIKLYHFFLFSIFFVVILSCFVYFQLGAANVGNAFVSNVIIIVWYECHIVNYRDFQGISYDRYRVLNERAFCSIILIHKYKVVGCVFQSFSRRRAFHVDSLSLHTLFRPFNFPPVNRPTKQIAYTRQYIRFYVISSSFYMRIFFSQYNGCIRCMCVFVDLTARFSSHRSHKL